MFPFTRKYQHNCPSFLDYFHFEDDQIKGILVSNQFVIVKSQYENDIKNDIRQYQKFKEDKKLLLLQFVTLSDYLHILTMASKTIKESLRDSPLDTKIVLFYLAAAVSDFSITSELMVIKL